MPGVCLPTVEIATWWITDLIPFWFRYQDVCNHLDLALSSLKQAGLSKSGVLVCVWTWFWLWDIGHSSNRH